ncbi:MAG: hypothetical protein M3165_02710 [Actinomycetota bacterium]|nr:hypothetical protein [Actinomycetota bacterium]
MIREPKTAIGRGSIVASVVVATSATTAALAGTAYGDAGATVVDAAVAQQQSIAVRPGIPIITERMAPDGGSICTLAFLYTDGEDTYAVTEGHCYASTSDIGMGFLHYRGASANSEANVGPIDKSVDAVYVAHPCARSLPPRLSGTNCYDEQSRFGSFVYALNNPFPDEGGAPVNTPLGRNNPALSENGDFGLIRLNDEVAYSPAMCLYGGPVSEYQHPADVNALGSPEPVYIYGQGGLVGRNFALQTPIAPGSPGLAFPSDPANPWTGTYTYTEAHAFEPAQSGGPIMTTDGRAFGVMGGVHYLDRLGPNIARAERYLNKDLQLLTAPMQRDAPPVGTDPACTPPVADAGGAS